MPARLRRRSGIAAALVAALALTGCAGVATMNKPLSADALSPDQSGPISKGGYRIGSLAGEQSPATLVLLSFSGGGKRSAAFGYGVLRGLRDFPVAIGGRQQRLLDEIDVMSSVSGGSFPATYYALYHDKIFSDFEKDFLHQDIESYIWGWDPLESTCRHASLSIL